MACSGSSLPPGSGTEAAAVAATGLFALQHRGQESAGVAVSDGAEIFLYKDLGMIAQVLDDRRLPGFRGDMAIAHCRYSTTGSTIWENAQPTFRLGPRRPVAIGHNGNLVNTRELLAQLEGGRARLAATTDTELLTTLLADEPAPDTVQALIQLLPRVRGAYSLLVLDQHRIIGIRDPHGFRPLVLGRIPEVATGAGDAAPWAVAGTNDGWILSSETTGLDIVGAEYVRDVEPGEMVILESGREPRSVRFAPATPALCVFEMIYFARPDSYMEGRSLYEVRRRMGEQLATEHPADADLVMPVPDTGAPAAAGYAEASGLPYREGLVRNRYTGRTFIQPSQTLRHRGVTMKLNPLRETVRGRRLTVVDDSIVRGTTTKQIVALLRKAGADRGPRPDQCAADLPSLLLWHRHPGRDRADRRDQVGGRDSRLHRRRFARLPLDPGRPRGARAALRPVLLRLLRRALSRAGPVRRVAAQVHARRAGAGILGPMAGGGVASVLGEPGVTSQDPSVPRLAYAASGVDVEAGERAVDLMRAAVESTRRPEVIGGLGGFGGAISIPPGYREPVIVSSTDGVGTKTAIAAAMQRWDTIGIDLVAMCADDVVCSGAEPLAFLDYVAVGRLDPDAVAGLVGGVAAGCRDAGCALVGR